FHHACEVVFILNVFDTDIVQQVLLNEQRRSDGIDHAWQRIELTVEATVPPGCLWQVGQIGKGFDRVAADEAGEVGALRLKEVDLVGNEHAQHIHGEDVGQLSASDDRVEFDVVVLERGVRELQVKAQFFVDLLPGRILIDLRRSRIDAVAEEVDFLARLANWTAGRLDQVLGEGQIAGRHD